MVIEQQNSIISSYLEWWHDAGLVAAVGDIAQPWLQPVTVEVDTAANDKRMKDAPRPPVKAVQHHVAPAIAKPEPLSEPMPDDLATFDLWLRREKSLPFHHWSTRPVVPSGPAHPEIMLLSDFPDDDDITQQCLFSGEQGALVSAMLAAIGIDASQQRHASIAFTRPPGRRLSTDEAMRLMPIALHQIALVQPKVILFLGQESCRLVTGISSIPVPENQPIFNHNGGNTIAYAIHHPRTLIERPQTKRHAWETLKRLRELS